jgi:hypothetical protein
MGQPRFTQEARTAWGTRFLLLFFLSSLLREFYLVNQTTSLLCAKAWLVTVSCHSSDPPLLS